MPDFHAFEQSSLQQAAPKKRAWGRRVRPQGVNLLHLVPTHYGMQVGDQLALNLTTLFGSKLPPFCTRALPPALSSRWGRC